MNLALALGMVPRHLIDESHHTDRRGKHNRQPRGEDHPRAVMTRELADRLREIRARDGLKVRDLHAQHAPNVAYWTVKSIFRSDSAW